MSGDSEPREYVAGALRALAEDSELRATLVGDAQLISAALATQPIEPPQLTPPERRRAFRAMGEGVIKITPIRPK